LADRRSYLFSASASRGLKSLCLNDVLSRSNCFDTSFKESLKRFAVASSESTSSNASSGQNSTHCGVPPQRSHTVAKPVLLCIWMQPYSQAWTHQSQPLHFFSSIRSKPVSWSCSMASSGHAFTHFASIHARQAKAKLKTGVRRTTRILERKGLRSFFSWLHANSQTPQPVHLLGSTDKNFRFVNVVDIFCDLTFAFAFGVVARQL